MEIWSHGLTEEEPEFEPTQSGSRALALSYRTLKEGQAQCEGTSGAGEVNSYWGDYGRLPGGGAFHLGLEKSEIVRQRWA